MEQDNNISQIPQPTTVQIVPPVQPVQPEESVQTHQVKGIDFAKFKKFFLFSLIGSLIISALVAVITVLVGDLNEITSRVFSTLGMVVIHSLMSLLFIWDDEKQNTFERLAFFINVLFSLIVLSFLTSIFGIWKILPSDLVWDLYQIYFVMGFASLHGDILSKAFSKEKYMDVIIYVNYVVMGIVVLILLPIILIDNSYKLLGEFYFRILGAIGIIDGTLSILTMIFYKLYLHKHPEEIDLLAGQAKVGEVHKKGLSVWVWIFVIYIVTQVVTSFIFGISSLMYNR